MRSFTTGAAVLSLLIGFGALSASAAPSSIDVAATASAVAVREGRSGGPSVGGCPTFPADNAWNSDITALPRRSNSDAMIARIQGIGGRNLHPDFGENPSYGIPFVVVPAGQALVSIHYTAYGSQSDPGPFPIPLSAPVESGSDAHVLVVRQGTCDLFELFAASRTNAGWDAQSGARFNLGSNALRPEGWTSADAAGLAILPGLARCDEVSTGRIEHAIRVTFGQTQAGWIHPATHAASSSNDQNLPAMGQRFRLRADFDISPFTGQARILLEAFRHFGLITADNGSNWFFGGSPGACWHDAELNQLKSVPGTAFEAVDTGPVLG